ncbi:unnamed protein product [Nesidiocoris tenuis]|uniref:Uncharacterized protein n=1 Tax=Nesidiocoris tenuis TaxID=355587 RepID=A0A6H5HR47_9HEMI|nr:unnamed protein product [Nesidiocoris tenuis]
MDPSIPSSSGGSAKRMDAFQSVHQASRLWLQRHKSEVENKQRPRKQKLRQRSTSWHNHNLNRKEPKPGPGAKSSSTKIACRRGSAPAQGGSLLLLLSPSICTKM